MILARFTILRKSFYESIYGCRFFQIHYFLSPLQDYSPIKKEKRYGSRYRLQLSGFFIVYSIDVSLTWLWVSWVNYIITYHGWPRYPIFILYFGIDIVKWKERYNPRRAYRCAISPWKVRRCGKLRNNESEAQHYKSWFFSGRIWNAILPLVREWIKVA